MSTEATENNPSAGPKNNRCHNTNTSTYQQPTNTKKFNIVELYHQIIWAGQRQQQQNNSEDEAMMDDENTTLISSRQKKKKRVTFSHDSPIIYEYEPEYTKNRLFDYSYFKHKFNHHSQEEEEGRPLFKQRTPQQYVHQQSTTRKVLLEETDDDEVCYHTNHRLMKTKSLSEFMPVCNQQFGCGSLVDEMQQQQTTPNLLAHSINIIPPANNESTLQQRNNKQHQHQKTLSKKEESDDSPSSCHQYNVVSSGDDTDNGDFHLFLDEIFNNDTTSSSISIDTKCDNGNAFNNTVSEINSNKIAAAAVHNQNTTTATIKGSTGGKAFFQKTLKRIKLSPPKFMRR